MYFYMLYNLTFTGLGPFDGVYIMKEKCASVNEVGKNLISLCKFFRRYNE
jgi:hypothetical protein